MMELLIFKILKIYMNIFAQVILIIEALLCIEFLISLIKHKIHYEFILLVFIKK